MKKNIANGRIIACLLTVCLLFGLTSCHGQKNDAPSVSQQITDSNTQTEEASETDVPRPDATQPQMLQLNEKLVSETEDLLLSFRILDLITEKTVSVCIEKDDGYIAIRIGTHPAFSTVAAPGKDNDTWNQYFTKGDIRPTGKGMAFQQISWEDDNYFYCIFVERYGNAIDDESLSKTDAIGYCETDKQTYRAETYMAIEGSVEGDLFCSRLEKLKEKPAAQE